MVSWTLTPKPLLGVRFSHPLPFRILSSSGAAFYIVSFDGCFGRINYKYI